LATYNEHLLLATKDCHHTKPQRAFIITTSILWFTGREGDKQTEIMMPHLILEYSENIEIDIQPLFAELHDEMVATGAINMKGLKSRAIRHTEYRIADGYEGYGFVHLNILIREGRTLEMQQEIARRAMDVLEQTFGHRFQEGYISLSVDVREMRRDIALTRHNIPRGGVVP
ncbi:MAG: 5-carboxymethyl-2-hydroxymuconate Delta-isomerase, partial [Ardenticatenaceae bacterium]